MTIYSAPTGSPSEEEYPYTLGTGMDAFGTEVMESGSFAGSRIMFRPRDGIRDSDNGLKPIVPLKPFKRASHSSLRSFVIRVGFFFNIHGSHHCVCVSKMSS